MQWSYQIVRAKGTSFSVAAFRLLSGDLVKASDALPLRHQGNFSLWLAHLTRMALSTFLRQNGLLIDESGSTDVRVDQQVVVRVRFYTVKRPVPISQVSLLISRFQAIGPVCDQRGHLVGEPADFYGQISFMTPSAQLKDVFRRETGTVNALFFGAGHLPLFLREGHPLAVGPRLYLSVPMWRITPADELPPLLREAAASLRRLKD